MTVSFTLFDGQDSQEAQLSPSLSWSFPLSVLSNAAKFPNAATVPEETNALDTHITQVFISDLHLSADEPALVQAFLALTDALSPLPALSHLYILGDWFEVWIGDDAYLSLSASEKQTHWLTPVVDALRRLSNRGCQTYVMWGNRDFLIGQAFCDLFNGTLLPDPFDILLGDTLCHLTHGDALCTDDVRYQRLRRVLQHPLGRRTLLALPLSRRQRLADTLRQKSRSDTARKPMSIMDVNADAVRSAITDMHADIPSCQTLVLLHGHTHRPAVHYLTNDTEAVAQSTSITPLAPSPNDDLKNSELKTNDFKNSAYRMVLGDWRVMNEDNAPPDLAPRVSQVSQVSAVIAVSDGNSMPVLVEFRFR